MFKIKTSCLIIPEVACTLPNFYIASNDLNLPKDIQLADPSFNIPDKIDILIGAGYFWDIIQNKQIILIPNLPKLQKTVFGWIVTGFIPPSSSDK